jgi:hypothetical protein
MKSVYRIRTGVVIRANDSCHHVARRLDRRERVLHAARPILPKKTCA